MCDGVLSGRDTAVYYKRKLYCCPVDTPPLINIEASACRLAMTGHGTLIIVSVYLPPHKPLLQSDIETLFAMFVVRLIRPSTHIDSESEIYALQ
ncbi:hypothetical protein EVAR_96398_1 [Eumeta japonica]|uniref:Uncharacterized protein n=1 Tax=Eumeta variegata TaxID=151549 RepID=A0A4C1WBU0_EUMVA|nr:hypothetical protein EVAR_96398_1 [Eumeta japonica]